MAGNARTRPVRRRRAGRDAQRQTEFVVEVIVRHAADRQGRAAPDDECRVGLAAAKPVQPFAAVEGRFVEHRPLGPEREQLQSSIDSVGLGDVRPLDAQPIAAARREPLRGREPERVDGVRAGDARVDQAAAVVLHIRPIAETTQHPRHLPEDLVIVRVRVQKAEQFVQFRDLCRGAEIGELEHAQKIQPGARAQCVVRTPHGGEIGKGSRCSHRQVRA